MATWAFLNPALWSGQAGIFIPEPGPLKGNQLWVGNHGEKHLTAALSGPHHSPGALGTWNCPEAAMTSRMMCVDAADASGDTLAVSGFNKKEPKH